MITLPLEESVETALECLSIRQGRDKVAVVAELVKRYVEAERLRAELLDPGLIELYMELADEDTVLADEDIANYAAALTDADQNDPR